jgi:hypothetical protein
MSAVFKQASDRLSLSESSQGDLAFVHALFKYADANNTGSDVLTNPISECIRRLEAAGINPHALHRIKELLAKQEIAYAAGGRP